MKIRIGTRGSNLALTQTKWVERQLKEANSELETEIVIIKTKGDKILDKALDKIGDKGLFVKELEQALFDESIDVAVHSMKDMPSEMPDGLLLGPTPKRADYRDVLILKPGYKTLDDVPEGGILGTGSKRRCYQLTELRPDLSFEPVRGNIETRIKKIETMNLDGVVLAAAGIHRLGLEAAITMYLDDQTCLAAPAQGALAIQYREGDSQVYEWLNTIADQRAQKEIEAERAFLKQTEGGCHAPVGAHADIQGETLVLTGLFGNDEGSKLIKKVLKGSVDQAKELGTQLADDILKELAIYER